MVEYHTTNTLDWIVGEYVTGNARSLSNPLSNGHPDYYQGTNWYSGSSYSTYVHTNCGVQNKWFYLLYGEIGIHAARNIAYRNLTTKLFSTAKYADSRNGSIQAAKELYGPCSEQVAKNRQAWSDVGVGISINDDYCARIMGPGSVCSSRIGVPVNYVYTVSTSISPLSVIWSVTGASYHTSGNQLIVTQVNNINFQVGALVIYQYAPILIATSDSKVITIQDCSRPTLFTEAERAQLHPDGVFAEAPPRLSPNMPAENPVIRVYPNPAEDHVTIKADNDDVFTGTLSDLQGRKIQSFFFSGSARINVRNLAAGTYLVHLQSGNHSEVKKIIVTH